MATSNEPYVAYPGTAIVSNEVSDLGATVETLHTPAKFIHFITFDNTNNTAVTYLKGWDDASVTVGTTAPAMVIPCRAGKKGSMYMMGGELVSFPNNTKVAALTTAGTGGTTAPASTFNCDVATDDT